MQCSADGNPEPSYNWTDLVSGTVIQGAVLNISEDTMNRSHTFQCTAINQHGNTSSSLNFTVAGIDKLLSRLKFAISAAMNKTKKKMYGSGIQVLDTIVMPFLRF